MVLEILKILKAGAVWLSVFITGRQQKKQLDGIDKATDLNKEANKIESDEERLKKKKEAADALEKALSGK